MRCQEKLRKFPEASEVGRIMSCLQRSSSGGRRSELGRCEEGSRRELEGAMLLALKVEEGATSQECRLLRSWGGESGSAWDS
jgi:hypothetical protein